MLVRVQVLVVRPDKYVFAVYTHVEAGMIVQDLNHMLKVGGNKEEKKKPFKTRVWSFFGV